jgi:hypothetical protein
MMVSIVKVAALLLVGLCLVPVGAHLLEMPAKMALDRDSYFAPSSSTMAGRCSA